MAKRRRWMIRRVQPHLHAGDQVIAAVTSVAAGTTTGQAGYCQ
jgi:hypothetical protein